MYFFNSFLISIIGNIYLFIPIIIVLIVLLVSSFYDLKFGIVPNFLSKLLIVFSIIFNLFLVVIYSNFYFIINALIMGLLIFLLSLFLWKIKFWGGGDLKLFTGMGIALGYLSSPIFLSLKCMPYMSQNFSYFPILSILFNSILISFPFLLILVFINFFQENDILIKEVYEEDKPYSNPLLLKIGLYLTFLKVFLFNIRRIIHISSEKIVNIADLEEGMIINKYYYEILSSEFNNRSNEGNENNQEDGNKQNLFNEVLNISKNHGFSAENLNLDFGEVKIQIIKGNNSINLEKEENNKIGYIESSNGMGLTKEDLIIINNLFKKGYLKNPDFSIKRGIAFVPSLTLGYLIFLFYGDLITIVSTFLVNLL